MKNKASKFKNPFDLMEQEQENVSFTPNSYVQYRREQRSSGNPLPFNPYEISPSQPSQPTIIEKRVEKNPQNPKKSVSPSSGAPPKTNGFNPFQQQQTNPNISAFNSNQSIGLPKSAKQYEPQKVYELNQDGDPPLLQDIGIQPEKIKHRILAVIKLAKPDNQVMEDPDLSGPILIALCFGCLLLLSGKVHFGDIYAIFIFGNVLLYTFFNFMSQSEAIPFYNIMSTVGYGLLPMCLLGVLGIFAHLNGMAGTVFGLALAGWCSFAAGNYVEALMKESHKNRKLLIVYPLFLFYISFAMIVMF